MDAFDWIAGVYMTALAMAKCMDSKELTRSSLILPNWERRWARWPHCGNWMRMPRRQIRQSCRSCKVF